MVKQDKEIKEKIIQATMELIKQHGDTSKDNSPGYRSQRWRGNWLDQLSLSDQGQSRQHLYPGIDAADNSAQVVKMFFPRLLSIGSYGLIAFLFYKKYQSSLVIGLVVFSHWNLDFIIITVEFMNQHFFFAKNPDDQGDQTDQTDPQSTEKPWHQTKG